VSRPAARQDDMHTCPQVHPGSPPVPHVGGPINGPGCATVLIDGRPAAVMGDGCSCTGAVDMITSGAATVYIGGRPAASLGDNTMHGGQIVIGSQSVLIGGNMEKMEAGEKGNFIIPSEEEKSEIINRVIKNSIFLLKKKLTLLYQNHLPTISQLVDWFGNADERTKKIIIERIEKTLAVATNLSSSNFSEATDVKIKRKFILFVLAYDDSHSFFVGDLFWWYAMKDESHLAGSLMHELSHFDDVGPTEDFSYEPYCKELALDCPDKALFNADSFSLFVKS
jgi:uncharacterized Zn-binding protein involved in type VI secretion